MNQPIQAALLPDNTVLTVDEMGVLRVSVYDMLHRRREIIPLMNCLVVPGLRTVLWSVPQFAQQGHQITFEYNTVRLLLNVADPQNRVEMQIAHPYFRQMEGPSDPIASAATVMAAPVRTRRQTRSQSSTQTPC